MKIKCYDIQWEIDKRRVLLPKNIVMRIKKENIDEISNILSDKYGWLINSLKYKILN